MRQSLFLGFLDIAEQRASGADGPGLVVDAESGQVVETEELQQLAATAVGIEQPRRTSTQAIVFEYGRRPAVLVRHQHLGRLQARQFGFQGIVAVDFVDQETTAGQISPGQSVALLVARQRKQQRVATFVEQGFVGDRARRDDAHHLAFDQAFRQRRIADLLADRHRFPERDQTRQIAFVGMHRHASHRDRLARGVAALGQGDVEQPRRLARVVVEQFVEIAHPEEHQHVRMLRLGGEELAHQGCVFGGHRGYSAQAQIRWPPSLPEAASTMDVIDVPDDDTLLALATALGARLREGRHRLVTAESCTGGWIAKTVTDIAGSSDWFECGLAAYSYEAKQALLGVRPETLEHHGAVSRETVIEMVSGALSHTGATIAVAVTGIAGPGGGTDDKPVGTVWIGWKRRGGYPKAELFHFGGDREAVRRQTVAAALRGLDAIVA